MRRKGVLALVLFITLIQALPIIYADIENLWVDGFTATTEEWDETGASPWLSDSDANYISEDTDGNWHDYFSFSDPGGSGTVNDVEIRLELQGPSARNDQFDLSIHNGTNWYLFLEYDSDADAYEWVNTSVLAYFPDFTAITDARLRVQYDRSGSPSTQTIYLRRAFLWVDYTLAGTDYQRDVTLGLSYSSNVDRTWSLTRVAELAIAYSSNVDRTWSLTRVAELAISWASTSFGEYLAGGVAYVRDVALGLSGSFGVSRNWILTRVQSLGITQTSNIYRVLNIVRMIGQSLTSIFSGTGTSGFVSPIVHSGSSWMGLRCTTTYSVLNIVNNAPPNPVQFVQNRYVPTIKLSIVPEFSRTTLFDKPVRIISIFVEFSSGEERITMEDSVSLCRDPVNVTFSPELKFSRGPLDLYAHEYTMTVSTSDRDGYSTYSEFIIPTPWKYTVLRTILILLIVFLIIIDLFGSE